MARVYRSVRELSWVMGVLSLFAALLVRLVPGLVEKYGFSARGGLVLAAVLFLCVLASNEAQKSAGSS